MLLHFDTLNVFGILYRTSPHNFNQVSDSHGSNNHRNINHSLYISTRSVGSALLTRPQDRRHVSVVAGIHSS